MNKEILIYPQNAITDVKARLFDKLVADSKDKASSFDIYLALKSYSDAVEVIEKMFERA